MDCTYRDITQSLGSGRGRKKKIEFEANFNPVSPRRRGFFFSSTYSTRLEVSRTNKQKRERER